MACSINTALLTSCPNVVPSTFMLSLSPLSTPFYPLLAPNALSPLASISPTTALFHFPLLSSPAYPRCTVASPDIWICGSVRHPFLSGLRNIAAVSIQTLITSRLDLQTTYCLTTSAPGSERPWLPSYANHHATAPPSRLAYFPLHTKPYPRNILPFVREAQLCVCLLGSGSLLRAPRCLVQPQKCRSWQRIDKTTTTGGLSPLAYIGSASDGLPPRVRCLIGWSRTDSRR